MPELPEVEALAAYLRERAVGRRVERLEVAAISALKTYDPPPTAVAGRTVTGAGRHGKFLDVGRRRRPAPGRPPGPGRLAALPGRVPVADAAQAGQGPDRAAGPARRRLRLRPDRGRHPEEAGRLPGHATRPQVPGRGQARARTRWRPTCADVRRAAAQPPRPGQGRAHRPGGARRGRQRVLRRDPARGASCPRSRSPTGSPTSSSPRLYAATRAGARPTRSRGRSGSGPRSSRARSAPG